ncbi:hypothetical protein BV22DRAFT_1195899 [Leucogyrophana mollusca]|uniref:Uncharacterized protein n=1 Tax=Leucogyrophana mollusca TaxID=85980 RepID=A0ACB8BI59_9AGAM|nr:hypothetical protein BV22DRAFT_1195899 [Leucogyrophana mollusca]
MRLADADGKQSKVKAPAASESSILSIRLPMSKSSLSSVVSGLVRASMGTAVSSTVTDEDLDRHVAELILKEAKQKAESYTKLGFKAYLPANPDPNAPRPNKRFLSSIIRSTDDHNKTILRAQALAAQEIKREREEQERKERRARAEEAVAAERMRRLMGSGRKKDDWDTGKEDTGTMTTMITSEKEKKDIVDGGIVHVLLNEMKRDVPGGVIDDHHLRSGMVPRLNASVTGIGDVPADTDTTPINDAAVQAVRFRLDLALSLPAKRRPQMGIDHTSDLAQLRHPMTKTEGATPPDEDSLMEVESRRVLKGKYKAQEDDSNLPPPTRSPSPPHPTRRPPSPSTPSSRTARSPSPSARTLPSKMDKYFEESYDPRLDVAPLTVPTVPATGLVSDAEFAGWDAMLELLRQRREDKEEKKRMERLGIGKEKSSGKGKKKAEDLPFASGVGERWASGGDSIMDIEYKKRGSVREWDLGKEGF